MVSKWFYDTFAVYFHAHRLAFSTKMHSILRQNAPFSAANSPETGANCGFMQCTFILTVFTTNPILHQN